MTAAPASAAQRFTIRGAGFGHGVGMSQYGAMGSASNGWGYRRILGHYYSNTEVVRSEQKTVRVLIQSPRSASFSGANRAGGVRLSPARSYRVTALAHGRVGLYSARGRRLARVAAPLTATASRPIELRGASAYRQSNGSYRGVLEFRPGSGGSVNVINALSVDDYVRGVVPLEISPTWPIEAVKAQAVAARTYALATRKPTTGFDHYSDTRSQVYGGVGAEHAASNRAIDATAGELVTYRGRPVVTYFFSTSGGRTENVETSALGTSPLPWLRSVPDLYDAVSPRHRWGPIRMSMRAAGAKLSRYVRGRFRGIEVIERGASPRIVRAHVVGTRGRVEVTGAQLRWALGLSDPWAYFTSISTGKPPKALPKGPVDGPNPAPVEDPPPTPGSPRSNTGGAAPTAALAAARAPRIVSGSVFPARRGTVVGIERRRGARWVVAGRTHARAGGYYRAAVGRAGVYRVTYRGDAGPSVRIG